MDIAFVYHQNIAQVDFRFLVYFFKSIMSSFDIGEDSTRMGLAGFGGTPNSGNDNDNVVFDFAAMQTLPNLKSRIDEQMEFQPGKGKLIDALSLANNHLFKAGKGSRKDVPKVQFISVSNIFLLTKRKEEMEIFI